VTGSPTAMLTLFVLVVIMAVALATFFQRKVTALAALLGIPVALFLNKALGGLYALLLVVVGVLVTLVIHTISDTYRLLRAAERRPRHAAPERRAATRRSERSRIAA
jgi:energy-coupling factor transporter transmembrane protein EcfT